MSFSEFIIVVAHQGATLAPRATIERLNTITVQMNTMFMTPSHLERAIMHTELKVSLTSMNKEITDNRQVVNMERQLDITIKSISTSATTPAIKELRTHIENFRKLTNKSPDLIGRFQAIFVKIIKLLRNGEATKDTMVELKAITTPVRASTIASDSFKLLSALAGETFSTKITSHTAPATAKTDVEHMLALATILSNNPEPNKIVITSHLRAAMDQIKTELTQDVKNSTLDNPQRIAITEVIQAKVTELENKLATSGSLDQPGIIALCATFTKEHAITNATVVKAMPTLACSVEDIRGRNSAASPSRMEVQPVC